MNRENKKRKYDKKYFRTHPCMDPFTCKVCGWPVVPAGAGSGHRNHCPNCLYSLHLDQEPGDRASDCHGRMEPIGVWGEKERGVGHPAPVSAVRQDRFKPHCGGRQSYEAHGPGHAPLWEQRHLQGGDPGHDSLHGGIGGGAQVKDLRKQELGRRTEKEILSYPLD